MKIRKIYLFIILIVFCVSQIACKSNKEALGKAKVANEALQYSAAIDMYKLAYSSVEKKDKADIIFKITQCYHSLGDCKQTELWAIKADKVKYSNPLVYLYWADALKGQGRYDEATVQYNKYKELRPSDERGEIGAKSSQIATEWKQKPTRYAVTNEAQLNSKADDYSPGYHDKKYKELLFTSTREGVIGKEIDGITNTGFSDIFFAKVDNKGKWSTPTPIGETVNTAAAEATPRMDAKRNVLYFTRCGVEKKVIKGCMIMMAAKKAQDFELPERLPFPGNNDTAVNDSLKLAYTLGHPAISKDGLSLYFAADLPGGYGGKDIWVVTRKRDKDQWLSQPVNLGPTINTAGDENFPFVHADGTLYFSSNALIGLGGFDIFKAKNLENDPTKFGQPENLKSPINSEGDDFGIIFEDEHEKGYFSSNRPGGKKGMDIYSFILPPLEFTLSGTVVDSKTKAILPLATVKLYGSDGTSLEVKTDAAGMYMFDKKVIMANTSYVLNASHNDKKSSKPDYLNKTGKITTINLDQNTDLILNFELDPIDKPIRLPEIRYAYDSWELLPESRDSLNFLIKTLNENPNITIQLRSHTDCRGSADYNRNLAQKRAQSCVDYLIEKGIDPERLEAKGMGKDEPRKVDFPTKYQKKDVILTPENIQKLAKVDIMKKDDQLPPEVVEAHQLNRRTDFKVLRIDYVAKK